MITVESHESNSPLVETVWASESTHSGSFTSLATSHSELVFTRRQGVTSVMLRGPESRASIADAPGDSEFFGITFKLGVFFSKLPPTYLRDRHAILPTTGGSFWINDQAMPIPDVKDTDIFIERLTRLGLLKSEPTVELMLQNELLEPPATVRTLQRRFLHATGLSHRTVLSVERAHRAVALLETGTSIQDVVHDLGYTDQPHLTKTLRTLVGQTPSRIASVPWLHSPLNARELGRTF